MLGFHVSKDKSTYEEAIESAHSEFGITAAQIFVSGPYSRAMTKMDHKVVKKTAKKLGVSLYAHNAHVGHPWEGLDHQIEYIQNQLTVCEKTGILGLVIHLPKKTIEEVMEVLPKLLHPTVEVLLEIPSMKSDPNLSWETPERINLLCRHIRRAKLENVGICVDTAHIFACGYDISTKAQAEEWLHGIKYPSMIRMIHLNDSKVPLGANKDIHAQLSKGLMWKDLKPKKSGMAPFINFAIRKGLPIILERAGLKNEGLMKKSKL
jgi:endonuclease IV